MDQNQLLQLLTSLRSTENEVRKAAEAQYDSIAQSQPAWMMLALAETCATTEDAGAVTLVLILLRKLFNTNLEMPDGSSRSVFFSGDADTQVAVKGRVLQVLGTAASGPQRGSAAACVSALAVAIHREKQTWDELWNSVFGLITTEGSSAEHLTICCEIIATVATNMTDFFAQYREVVSRGMAHCLAFTGPQAKGLKEAAFNAIVSLVPLGFKDDFAPLVPAMLQSVQTCLNEADWDTAEKLLISIVQGMSDSPQLFEQEASSLLAGLMQVAASIETPREVRHAAVEALVTFCEELPKTARKVPQFVTSFFELLFQYTLGPEFADNWDTTTDMEAEGDGAEDATDFLVAVSGLDRLAQAIGGRKLKSTAEKLYKTGIASPDWRYRNAAIAMICHITDGMKAAFHQQMGELVASILPSIKDEVKYVRAIALECIAQLSQDFGPELQTEHHLPVMTAVVPALRDPVPHVAASAARCIDAFFDFIADDDDDEDESPEVSRRFAQYGASISADCVELMKSNNLAVVNAALGALSSLISILKAEMTPYVANLVPVFQSVLAQPDSAEIMDCKCKAMECVTLLAAGVGKDGMGPYAQSICEFLKGLTQQGLKNDDPRFRFVLRGWTCMVECLKEDSLPYVAGVMPMLLNLMNLECDVIITEAPVGGDDDDAQEAPGVESLRIVIPGVGERIAKMHTGLIEDKELATNVVTAIMMELGVHLQSYFPEMARSAIKLLEFKVNDAIRESGALLLTSIMEAYEDLRSPDSQILAAEAITPLLVCLAEEPEADITVTILECLSHCIGSYPAVVTSENVEVISDKLKLTLEAMIKSRKEIVAKKKTEKDEDELDNLEEEDANVSERIKSTASLIGVLLERASVVFGPIFATNFFPYVAEWLQPSEDNFFVQTALSIICDFVEHAPAQAAPVVPTLLSSALAFATSRTDADLLQSDFYLMNNLVQYLANPANHMGDINSADFATQSQHALGVYLCTPQAATPDYLSATANAASAYVSLLEYFYAALGAPVVTGMLQTLTAVLPCDEDDVEARRVHDRVLGWIVSGHAVLQANAAAGPALLARIKAAKPENLSSNAKQQLAAM